LVESKVVSREFRGAVNIGRDFWAFTSVRGSRDEIERIVAADGVIASREHPGLRSAIEWRVRTGQLEAVLAGVFALPEAASLPRTRIAAVAHWDSDAVLTHEAAAAASFWPGIVVPIVRCAGRHQRAPRAGFQFSQRRIPSELIWSRGSLRLTSPALTALDLTESLGGSAIDQALRTRSTTLALVHTALDLTKGRAGNSKRQELLLDSRDEPWSEAERQFHRLLRAARITGWKANRPVLIDGLNVYPDVVFRRERLVIEIDGREFHSDPEVFESDRRRQNLFVLNGWRVLRITWRMITDDPDQLVAMVREAVTAAAVA
jgi:very-short-patch-repair endonuclease